MNNAIIQSQQLLQRLQSEKKNYMQQAKTFNQAARNPLFTKEERKQFEYNAQEAMSWAYNVEWQIDQEKRRLEVLRSAQN